MRTIAQFLAATRFVLLLALTSHCCNLGGTEALASSVAEGFSEQGPVDGNRFSTTAATCWKGGVGQNEWWWAADFKEVRTIGAILQVVGDHDFVFRNAPRSFAWERSDDGKTWSELPETVVANERRLFRIHRLNQAIRTRFVRFRMTSVTGTAPVLREVEFHPEPQQPVPFPDWTLVVNATHDSRLPNHGQEFIPLVRSCAGWSNAPTQQVWLDGFDVDFLKVEPWPTCAFISGSFKDWCEVNREDWRGAAQVLQDRRLPIWASCGGAQALAILSESGVDKPWDCPHCRDPRNPRLPIYTHIGHTAKRACGDYSACVFERGPHWVKTVTDDPVFAGLTSEFKVMESHCGQIEWAPAGWQLIAAAGPGTKTMTQCLRLKGAPVYAAQFHIEMEGTPESSRKLMENFLRLAKDRGGYDPFRAKW